MKQVLKRNGLPGQPNYKRFKIDCFGIVRTMDTSMQKKETPV
jgi:hypothetical protein